MFEKTNKCKLNWYVLLVSPELHLPGACFKKPRYHTNSNPPGQASHHEKRADPQERDGTPSQSWNLKFPRVDFSTNEKHIKHGWVKKQNGCYRLCSNCSFFFFFFYLGVFLLVFGWIENKSVKQIVAIHHKLARTVGGLISLIPFLPLKGCKTCWGTKGTSALK